jgi:hypothetical protein
MTALLYRRGRLAMIRFVADVIGHIPTFVENHLARFGRLVRERQLLVLMC